MPIKYIPTLLHADLKPEHILCDLESGYITGIIDWGDISIGDPDYDFTCFSLYYGQSFVRRLLHYFPEMDAEHKLKKVQFFILVRWLQDLALFFKSGDKKFVDFCLSNLRSHLLTLSLP